MARFSDLGITTTDAIIGQGVSLGELFGKRIIIEKTLITPSKYPGKNASGMRMQMQVVFANFHEEPDASGDYFEKDVDGKPKGERHSCFTGSDNLIAAIREAEAKGVSLYPLDTTIVKVGRCFQFT